MSRTCAHPDFAVDATIVRLLDTQRFVAEIGIRCSSCGVRFRWLGLPPGASPSEPMVSVDEFTLRAPIQPDAHLTSWMAEPPAEEIER